MNVLKGDDVPPASVHKAFDGVEGDDMSRVRDLQMLWFSQDFLTIYFFDLAEVGYLLRELPQPSHIFHEASDGHGLGAREIVCRTELCEKWVEFFFSEIWVLVTQATYLVQGVCVPETSPCYFGTLRSRI